MKIKFDAEELLKELSLIRSLPNPAKGMTTEEIVGLNAQEGTLTVYSYAKGQSARVVTEAVDVEETGTVFVSRTRLFQLLGTLKGEVKIRPSTSTKLSRRLEIQTKVGKFTLGLSDTTLTPVIGIKAKGRGRIMEALVPAAELQLLLKLGSLDGTLLGGGYRIAREKGNLSLMSTDALRLIIVKRECPGDDFLFTVNESAIKGVHEILKLAGIGEVNLVTNFNVNSLELPGEVSTHQFGFANSSEVFPDMAKIAGVNNHPNYARFDVEELLDTVERSSVLADKELAYADFHFDGEVCRIMTVTTDTSADVLIDAPAEIQQEETEVLRLRLDFIRMFLKKLKEAGAQWVNVSWGEKLPVFWEPVIEKDNGDLMDLDFKLICSALNRHAAV
jgi:DNA polymerase III sliding clamp (beta) subunit (PCNA family)